MAKKLLSVVLTVVLVLGVLPVTAFAAAGDSTVTYGNSGEHIRTDTDEEQAAAGKVCRIGTTYYGTIKEAYDALPAGTSTDVADPSTITVTLIANPDKDVDISGSKAMIVEGNGYTFSTFTTRAFTWTSADLTVRDLTIHSTAIDGRSVQFHPNNASIQMDVVFENCTIVSNDINIDLRGTETANTYKHTLTLDGCYIEVSSKTDNQNPNAIYGNHDKTADWNITINDSKLVCNAKQNIGGINGAIGLHTKSDIQLDINGDTVLEAATLDAGKGNYCVYINAATSVKLDIEETVEMIVNVPDSVSVTSNFVAFGSSAKNVTVNDAGATYKANANAVKNGVVVPTYGASAPAGYSLSGYAITKNATTGTALGETYKNTEATAGVEFYPYYTANPTDEQDYIALGYVAKTDVNGDGTAEYYKTVAAAIAALPAEAQLDALSAADMAKHTVTLIANVDASKWGGMIEVRKALILDGNGKTAKSPDDAYTALDVYSADVVFKNVSKFDGKRLMRVWADVDDVDISVIDSNVDITGCQGFYLRSAAVAEADKTAGTYTKGYNATLNLDGSTLTTSDSTWDKNNANPVFIHYHGQCYDVNWTVNVNDTTLTHSSQNSSTDAVIAAHMSADLTINLTGDTNINIQGTATDRAHYGIYVSDNYKGYDVNVNIAKTVKLNANIPTDHTQNTQFIKLPEGATLVNDGCQLIANANAAKNGVILPKQKVAEGEVFIGWTDGEKLIKADAPYVVDNGSGIPALTPVSCKFEMIAGASARIDGEMGIRFGTVVNEELAALNGTAARFGTILAIYDEYLREDTFNHIDLYSDISYREAVNLAFTEADENGDVTYYACLVNLPDSKTGVTTKFTARSYVEITFSDGSSEIIYADYSAEDNARSIYDIATAAVANGQSCEAYENIISIGGAQ